VIVVSNSSPLVALARIGRLALLASFYKRILIPAEVHHEVTVAGRGLPGAEEVRNANWIEVISQKSPGYPSLAQVCQGLGAGERAAILLAKSLEADLVLLDEWKARRVAQDAGLSVVGCLGILEAGAQRGLVPDLRQVYMDLLRQGIRFDIRLLQDSLARLGLPKL
jgi:predicted nucleic acid-binding protein